MQIMSLLLLCGAFCAVSHAEERKKLLESNGFTWSVVESVPVHESIKLGKAEREKYIQVRHGETHSELGPLFRLLARR